MIRAFFGFISFVLLGAAVFTGTGLIGSSQASISQGPATRTCAVETSKMSVAAVEKQPDGATRRACFYRPRDGANSESATFHTSGADID